MKGKLRMAEGKLRSKLIISFDLKFIKVNLKNLFFIFF
jgi:hypothetical protein